MPIVLLFCSEVGKAPDAPARVPEMMDTPPIRNRPKIRPRGHVPCGYT